MALPESRDFTLGADSIIPHALLNTLQDLAVGKCCPPSTKYMLPPNPSVPAWTRVVGSDLYIKSTGAGACLIPLETEQGDRITALSLKLYGNNTITLDLGVHVVADDMVTVTDLSTTSDIHRAAAWGTLAMPAFVAHVMAAGECLYLSANADAANARIGRISRTHDRLL